MQVNENFSFPFLNRRYLIPENDTYLKTIQSRFFPHFEWASMSTVIIVLNIVIFIVMHILFSPSSYAHFLSWPTAMDSWLLEVERVHSNKLFIYQAFTAMFMHDNYLHILGNTIFSIFIMYEMEASWKWSIPLGLVAGFAANCLAIITLEGRMLGFSGVLMSYLGMIVALFATHLTYLENRMPPQALCWLAFMIILFVFMAIGTGSSVLVHLYGFLFGIILALGFYPKHYESCITGPIGNVLKVVAALAVIAVLVLALTLWTTNTMILIVFFLNEHTSKNLLWKFHIMIFCFLFLIIRKKEFLYSLTLKSMKKR